VGNRVLIVDDSSTVRQQVSVALLEAGFDVLEAADGVQGAEAIENHDDLALVICDVNMPHMNGVEMVRRIKSSPRHETLPIVMLTTEGQPRLIREAKEAGAAGWIVKPFVPERLTAVAMKLARQRS